MSMIYREEMADISHLEGKWVAIIGYGNLGRPLALNLRDSGVRVIVGTTSEQGRTAAEEDTFPVVTIPEAVKKAQVIYLCLPNEIMPTVYIEQIAPHLRRGVMLMFSSAYTITYSYIEPPPFVDVGLVAPRIQAAGVRSTFESGDGYHSFLSVGQDATGNAWPVLLAVALAAGALRAGAVEVSFERETELDLFAQQTVLTLVQHVLTTAAKVLLERGYPPEAIFTELYLSRELQYYLEQVAQSGLLRALGRTPLSNQYGTLARLDRFNDLKLERLMEITLDEIHKGDFAKEWAKDFADGTRRLKTMLKNLSSMDLWELEQQTLEMLGRGDGDDPL